MKGILKRLIFLVCLYSATSTAQITVKATIVTTADKQLRNIDYVNNLW